MSKQKEYLEIIQKSGKYLLSLVNEISELGTIAQKIEELDLATVDIEMLCQQVAHSLEDGAKRKEQQIRLSVERERTRAWVIDKEKIRHLLYHLLFSVIQSATTGSIIRVHVFSSTDNKKVAVSVSHPWLGDGLIDVEPIFARLPAINNSQLLPAMDEDPAIAHSSPHLLAPQYEDLALTTGGDRANKLENADSHNSELIAPNDSHIAKQLLSLSELRLSLSCYLAQLHGGEITVESTPDAGYRYLLSLPNLKEPNNNS